MHVVHLMASPFFGGPERQMLGMALALPRNFQSTFLSFSERGLCRPFLQEARRHGFEAMELEHNFPHVRRAAQEVANRLRQLNADVLCCSGYKPDLIGLTAGRQAAVPVVSISHGWTGATWKVRVYESADRLALRWMNAVVCVSEGQAAQVRRTSVAPDRIHVIRNAVALASFDSPDPKYRCELEELFPFRPRYIVGAAGRLSPEKGFEKLIEAAELIVKDEPKVGFLIYGEGPYRSALSRRIHARGLREQVLMPGFRDHLEMYLPHFDVLALPSYTEGLPVILLEAMAAGVATVATAVGGVPEAIEDGVCGHLVPPGDSRALANRIKELLRDDELRRAFGVRGRTRVEESFTFKAQSEAYQALFRNLPTRANGNAFAGTSADHHFAAT